MDFTGGVLVELGADQALDLDALRALLDRQQIEGASVQHFGSANSVLIRLPASARTNDPGPTLLKAAQSLNPQLELRRVEFIGPQVGEELTVEGGLALLWTLICIFIYVVLRFHWKLSAGAVVALAHDVLIVLGAFSLMQWSFDLSVLAALLAVIGYSLNDTIVVFDRCRENLRRKQGDDEVAVMNRSINEMLSRTLMTSLTTLLVLLALLLVGGPALAGFSRALLLGVVIGTYSSIYVAGNAALMLGLRRDDLILPPPPDDLDGSGAQL